MFVSGIYELLTSVDRDRIYTLEHNLCIYLHTHFVIGQFLPNPERQKFMRLIGSVPTNCYLDCLTIKYLMLIG